MPLKLTMSASPPVYAAAAAGVLLGLGDRKKPALILLAAGAVHLLALFMLSPSDNRIVTVNKTGLISMFYWLLNAVVMVIAAAVRLSVRHLAATRSSGRKSRDIFPKVIISFSIIFSLI